LVFLAAAAFLLSYKHANQSTMVVVRGLDPDAPLSDSPEAKEPAKRDLERTRVTTPNRSVVRTGGELQPYESPHHERNDANQLPSTPNGTSCLADLFMPFDSSTKYPQQHPNTATSSYSSYFCQFVPCGQPPPMAPTVTANCAITTADKEQHDDDGRDDRESLDSRLQDSLLSRLLFPPPPPERPASSSSSQPAHLGREVWNTNSETTRNTNILQQQPIQEEEENEEQEVSYQLPLGYRVHDDDDDDHSHVTSSSSSSSRRLLQLLHTIVVPSRIGSNTRHHTNPPRALSHIDLAVTRQPLSQKQPSSVASSIHPETDPFSEREGNDLIWHNVHLVVVRFYRILCLARV
jgi:hypothetical protein